MSILPKKIRDWRYAIFYGLVRRRGFPLLKLGQSCYWTFCPKGLGARSVVYSAGVGKDITFEHALVKQFGCKVVLVDPSPTGRETMEQAENRIPEFKFFPVGLAGHPGTLSFAPPRHPQEGSWFAQGGQAATLELPCVDLCSLMQQNGHDHIDLLKIDIEGCEYEVIEDLLERRLPVRQLCVEYHHGILPEVRRSQTVRSILKLVRHGYKLLDHEGNNHTFLRPS
jgi:FkbM family methyltransferase